MKVKRNDPCPCGSGMKYKKCCWKEQELKRSEREKEEIRKRREYAELINKPESELTPEERDKLNKIHSSRSSRISLAQAAFAPWANPFGITKPRS